MGPADQTLRGDVAVAIALAGGDGTMAVYAVAQVDIPRTYVIPFGARVCGIVEAVVVEELGRVSCFLGDVDGPIVRSAVVFVSKEVRDGGS